MSDTETATAPVSTETEPDAVVTIPLQEWRDHVKRVDFMVHLLNGILSGLAQHPMGKMMLPPEALAQLQSTLPQGG